MVDFNGSWYDHLILIEIHMDSYEALYRHRCRSLIDWFKVDETVLIGPDSVHEAMAKV